MIGCVAELEQGDQAPQAAASQAPKAPAESPAPAPGATATASAEPETAPAVIAPRKVIPPPVQLIGMSREDIIRHFGKPAFQRRDQTALLLRYREGRCILDLYLYPRVQGEPGKAVDYFEARADDGQLIETEPCINAVRKAKAAG